MTSVLFQGSEKLISTGAMDGKIKIWDLRKTYTNLKQEPVPFHTFPYPGHGVRKHGRLYERSKIGYANPRICEFSPIFCSNPKPQPHPETRIKVQINVKW